MEGRQKKIIRSRVTISNKELSPSDIDLLHNASPLSPSEKQLFWLQSPPLFQKEFCRQPLLMIINRFSTVADAGFNQLRWLQPIRSQENEKSAKFWKSYPLIGRFRKIVKKPKLEKSGCTPLWVMCLKRAGKNLFLKWAGRFTTTNRKKKWTMLIGKDDVVAQTSAQHSRWNFLQDSFFFFFVYIFSQKLPLWTQKTYSNLRINGNFQLKIYTKKKKKESCRKFHRECCAEVWAKTSSFPMSIVHFFFLFVALFVVVNRPRPILGRDFCRPVLGTWPIPPPLPLVLSSVDRFLATSKNLRVLLTDFSVSKNLRVLLTIISTQTVRLEGSAYLPLVLLLVLGNARLDVGYRYIFSLNLCFWLYVLCVCPEMQQWHWSFVFSGFEAVLCW